MQQLPVRLDVALTTEDYLAFNEHIHEHGELLRGMKVRTRWVFTIAIALGVALGAGAVSGLEHEPTGWLVMLPAAVVGGIIGWFVAPRLAHAQYRRQLRRLADRGALGPVGPAIIWADEHGLHQQDSRSATSAPWASIRSVEDGPTATYVMLDQLAGFIIPVAADPAARQALLAAIRSRRSSRG